MKVTFHNLFRNVKSGWLVLGAPRKTEDALQDGDSLDTDFIRLGAVEIGVTHENELTLLGIA